MGAAQPILWDVFEEHVDEAAFLWSRWEGALRSACLTPREVISVIEDRLRAHLHALHLGGPAVAKRLVVPALAGDDKERVFVATFVLLESGRLQEVLQALHRLGPKVLPGAQRALQLHGLSAIDTQLLPLAVGGVPAVQIAALETLAFRGCDASQAILAASASHNPALLAAAARAARNSPTEPSLRFVRNALGSSVVAIRDAAIETGLVCGLPDAWLACKSLLASGKASATVLLLAALGGDAADLDAILAAMRSPEARADALWAAGFSGRVAAAEASLELMSVEDPPMARLAGEAFSAITGLRLEGPFCAPPPPEREEPIPFEQEDLDASLEWAPENELPLPQAERVKEWWNKNRSRFAPAVRYLGGVPFGVEPIGERLENGPMRRRHVLALELEIRTRGALRIQSRRWLREQKFSLAAVGANQLAMPFDMENPGRVSTPSRDGPGRAKLGRSPRD
jgi:uncharacterized protein (TIGR02270 family)